jgi:hypothetical protein
MNSDCRTQVRELRRKCDSLYYIFLKSYQYGLEGHWDRSMEKAKAKGENRESTPGRAKAKAAAEKAINTAMSAWDQYHNGELEASREAADMAVEFLTERCEFCFLFPVVNTLTNELYLQR